MPRAFKNALCLARVPDDYGFGRANYWRMCHRHADHPGPHRCQGVWEWHDGDEVSNRAQKRA